MDLATRILIVDDDQGIRSLISEFLEKHGYRTQTAADAAEMRARLQAEHFDLVGARRDDAERGRALGAAPAVERSGGGDGSASSTGTATATPTPTPTATSTGSGTCVADPTETNGPYPADGTNTSSGATSNVLQVSGIVRSDIRPSFIGSTTVASGVLLKLTLKLVDVASGCTPISGAAIYLWQCDSQGRYSLYSSGVTTESYLRGVLVTGSNGEVTFTTIYPACYDGRWPHVHFEVFRSGLTAASTGRTANLISQLAMPAATNTMVFNSTGYSSSLSTYARVSLTSDGVFGDNTSAQLAQMTPTLSGDVASGYTGSAVIGI